MLRRITGAKTNEEAIAASLVLALAHVAKSASHNLGQASKTAVIELISDAFGEDHDGRRHRSLLDA